MWPRQGPSPGNLEEAGWGAEESSAGLVPGEPAGRGCWEEMTTHGHRTLGRLLIGS